MTTITTNTTITSAHYGVTINATSTTVLATIDPAQCSTDQEIYFIAGDITHSAKVTVLKGSIGGVADFTFSYTGEKITLKRNGDSANFSLVSKEVESKSGFVLGNSGGTITQNATNYGAFGSASFDASEGSVKFIMPCAGTLKNFYIRTTSLQGDDDLDIFVMVNGAESDITVTVPSGSTANVFSDTTNTAVVAAGDTVDIKFINAASNRDTNFSSYSIFVEL